AVGAAEIWCFRRDLAVRSQISPETPDLGGPAGNPAGASGRRGRPEDRRQQARELLVQLVAAELDVMGAAVHDRPRQAGLAQGAEVVRRRRLRQVETHEAVALGVGLPVGQHADDLQADRVRERAEHVDQLDVVDVGGRVLVHDGPLPQIVRQPSNRSVTLDGMTFIEQSYPLRGAYLRIAVIAAALFVVGTNAFVIAGVLPQIAAGIGASPGAVSYSISWYAVVVAVLAPIVSVLFARASRAALMGTGMALIAAGIALSALAGDPTLFTAGRVAAALRGAAPTPAALAAAPALVPPKQRGRALGVVGFGFILATAIGSPLGTALASLGSWRAALGSLAGLAAVLAVAVALATRAVPTGVVPGLVARFAVLRDVRIGLALLTTLLFTAAFNLVYIFSSAVTQDVTGGDGTALASLLLVFGAAGVVGNWLGGSLTDRVGARPTALVSLGVVALSLVALYGAGDSYAGTAVLF